MERKGNRKQPEARAQKRRVQVFFQRQKKGSRCRMHALNNALGRAAISVAHFDAACDAFDHLYGLSGSRLYFLLADLRDVEAGRRRRPSSSEGESDGSNVGEEATPEQNESENEDDTGKAEDRENKDGEEGNEENSENGEENEEGSEVIDVLSYILRERFHYRTKYIPLGGTVGRLNREELDQCDAFLSFSESHVWANRRVHNTWYCLDSLQPRPTTIKPNKALASGLGHILIYSKSGGGRDKPSGVNERNSRKQNNKELSRNGTTKPEPEPEQSDRGGGETEKVGPNPNVDSLTPGEDQTSSGNDDEEVDYRSHEEQEDEEEGEEDIIVPNRNPFDCLADE